MTTIPGDGLMRMAIVALVLGICLGPIDAALAQGGASRDCQTDFGCFAEASRNCSPARVRLRVALPLSGTELEITQVYEIRGMEGDRCLFRSQVERVAARLDEGRVPREQLQRQRQVIAAILSGIEWLDVSCRFEPDELAVMLDRWAAIPVILNTELNRPECTADPD
jgi:hypothetical protein